MLKNKNVELFHFNIFLRGDSPSRSRGHPLEINTGGINVISRVYHAYGPDCIPWCLRALLTEPSRAGCRATTWVMPRLSAHRRVAPKANAASRASTQTCWNKGSASPVTRSPKSGTTCTVRRRIRSKIRRPRRTASVCPASTSNATIYKHNTWRIRLRHSTIKKCNVPN